MSLSVGSRFLVGVNKGWFRWDYDHDLGRNQFSGLRLYRPVIPNPSLPDGQPEPPYIQRYPTEIQDSFQKIQTVQQNVQVVRIWAFERFESLQFNSNGMITGLDPDFQANIRIVLDSAANKGLRIYLCLNSWSIYDGPSQDLIDAGKESDYRALQDTWKNLVRSLLKNQNILDSFINNALVPLIVSVGNHPALFAVDLMNEPEYVTDKDPSIILADLRNYIAKCSAAIHQANPSVLISCGFLRKSTIKNNASSLSSYLDFFDYHEYNTSGTLDPYVSSEFANKPCIIGECGYSPGNTPGNPNERVTATQNFLTNAQRLGYAGCLVWRPEDYANENDILQAIKSFSDTRPVIVQGSNTPPPPNGGRCFIATAAMGSELHPHVQYLREYRDSVLLTSRHKESFENLLEFYYSFSPPVANLMERNKPFKLFMKYSVVYPLLLFIKLTVKLFEANVIKL